MTTDKEVEQILRLLDQVIRVRGYTRTGLDEKLGLGRGYLSHLLSGRMELKVWHVLAILRAIGVEPLDFLEVALPRLRPRKPGRSTVEELLRGEPEPPPEPPPRVPSMAEIEAMIFETLRKVLGDKADLPVDAAPPDDASEPEPPR